MTCHAVRCAQLCWPAERNTSTEKMTGAKKGPSSPAYHGNTMNTASRSLGEVASFLDQLLEAPAYSAVRSRDGRGDQNGIYRESRRAVAKLALALEPWADLENDVASGEIDALFLHRPWRLTAEQHAVLEAHDIGVLAYHLSFDEHLTLGFNPPLAALLGLEMPPEVLGFKEGRPLGMLGRLAVPRTIGQTMERLREIFRGLELEHCGGAKPDTSVTHLAVVGAMSDALVRQAHLRGAALYVTGQWRQPATVAARETNMAVAAVGHLRSEIWGLRMLARFLRGHFPFAVSVHDEVNAITD